MTERGQNLYKQETGEWDGGGALPRKVCRIPLSYLISLHQLCLSVTSSSCPSCWGSFKFSSWGQSRELTWNFSWQSPHLLSSNLWAASCVFCSIFFIQHSSQGLAKAKRLTKPLHVQRHKYTRCIIPAARTGFETITRQFLLYFRKWRTWSFLHWNWYLCNTGRSNIPQGKFSYMQQLLSFMVS